MPNVVFAYNSAETIPSAGWTGPGATSGRLTFNVAFADGESKTVQRSVRHELIDLSTKRDMVGKGLVLRFKLGPGVLGNVQTIGGTQYSSAQVRSFFRSFFDAAFRWAVYGNFNDTSNSANANLCECDPTIDDVEVSIPYDRDTGYELVSQKTF